MKNCLKVAIFALAIFALNACNSSNVSGVDLNVDGGWIIPDKDVVVKSNFGSVTAEQTNISGWRYLAGAIFNKQLYFWGDGVGGTATVYNLDNEQIRDIVITSDTFVALTYSGKVYTYGYNRYGTLGDGTNVARKEFKAVEALKEVVINRIYANDNSVYAIDSNGKVWSWGRNDCGQLGIGNKNNNFTPTQLDGFDNNFVVDLAVGEYSVYAITINGQVYSWGDNTNGQLGIDNYDTKTSPVKITAFENTSIASISVGGYSSMSNDRQHTVFAVDRSGKLYGWGSNKRGMLGDPTPANTKVPSVIEGMKDKFVTSVVQANFGTVWALDINGNVYSWGSNNVGMLGRGVLMGVDDAAPKILNYFSDRGIVIKKVAAGNKTTSVYAVDSNGNAYSWGFNGRGQLGINVSFKSGNNSPTLITSLSDDKIVDIVSNRHIAFAVSDTGKIYTAGDNKYQNMGMGNQNIGEVSNVFIRLNTIPAK